MTARTDNGDFSRLCGARFRRSTAVWLAVATAAALATSAPIRATMVQRVSLEEVTRAAERIVHGTVAVVRSGRDESGLPATWITLAVSRTLKGPATPELTFKQYGVAEPLADGTITRVAGLPRYRVGEEVVLFLRGNSRRGFTSPVGFSQGAYRVSRTEGTAEVQRDLGSAAPQRLDAFFSEVTRLAAPVP